MDGDEDPREVVSSEVNTYSFLCSGQGLYFVFVGSARLRTCARAALMVWWVIFPSRVLRRESSPDCMLQSTRRTLGFDNART
jgi:uncharacterized ParB-like nuclease family protein